MHSLAAKSPALLKRMRVWIDEQNTLFAIGGGHLSNKLGQGSCLDEVSESI